MMIRAILLTSLYLLSCGQAVGRELQPAKVRVHGVELHYIEQGQGETVILLHGGTGDYRSWGGQMESFSRHYRVISYSRRYSYPNQNLLTAHYRPAYTDADDLAAFIRHLKLGPVHLIGTSYGALTALVLAVRHPEMVRSLVLAEPPAHQLIRDVPGGESVYSEFMGGVWEPAAQEFRQGEARRAMRTLADGIWGRPVFDTLPPEGAAAVMQNARAMEALTLSPDPFPLLPKAKLRRLSIPVLIINGEHAIRIHKLVNEELARLLPRGLRVVIPNAGHGSPRENPQAFNSATLDFLARLRARGHSGN